MLSFIDLEDNCELETSYFKKIGGELPQGLRFNTDGVLYGSVNVLDENKTDYTFDVNVYVDGIEYTPSLKKSIKLHINEKAVIIVVDSGICFCQLLKRRFKECVSGD